MAQYHFPPVSLLDDYKGTSSFIDLNTVNEYKKNITALFESLKMNVRVMDSSNNSYSILLKLRLGEGVNTSSVRKLKKDIELNVGGNPVDFMDSEDGRGITIAVKNEQRPPIMFRDMIESPLFRDSFSPLTIAAGVNLFEGTCVFDLAKLPNLLVLGVTGAGKTTFLNDLILSILYKADPKDVQMALIDTKGVDLPHLNGIPHMKQFETAEFPDAGIRILKWLKNESDERLSLLNAKKAEDIDSYNHFSKEKKPRFVLVIDEYSDFKERSRKEQGENVDQYVESIARSSEKTGIHLVIASQSARADCISTNIKNAIPARACLVVQTAV